MCELRNCPICNGLFTFRGASTVCPDCFDTDQSTFNRVRDYIKEHPGCDFLELSAATGIREETLFRYIREGRIVSGKI